MQTVLMQNEASRARAVTRTRSLATCVPTRVPTAAPISGVFGTRGVTASAEGTSRTATAWSLYIAKPMPKVNFHDRWPLGSTP